MKRTILVILLLALAVVACSPPQQEELEASGELAPAAVASPTAEPTATEPPPTATAAPTQTPTPAATVDPNATPTWTPIPREETSLRSLADQRDVLFGTSVKADALFSDQAYMNTVAQEFNFLVIEWELNFLPVNPQRGEYNFSRADPVFAFAEANDMTVHANTLVWYRSVPDWFINGDFTQEEATEILRNHVSTLMGRYKGQAYMWDVVNEVFTDDGEMRESPWLDQVGPDYVEKAFRFAREADPDALLFYNDYGAEMPNAKSDAIYEMVKDFKERGVPIDGVGFQFHGGLDNRRDPEKVAENFQRFADLGVEVYVSEMDVGIRKGVGTELQRLELQADVYAEILEVCLEAENCNKFVVWGVSDQHSWLVEDNNNEKPMLFDRNYQPKLAYEAVIDVLEKGATGR